MSQSKYEFRQQASLSQQLANKDSDYPKYAGADPKTSLKIMFFRTCAKHKMIDLDAGLMPFFMDYLDGKRKVLFATSERVNEVSKMGLQMPKARSEIDVSDDI